MIENIEQLKSERPDLVELFENMTKEELLKQCYLECIDAINMESRVQTFMNECTVNLSKTNYTIESIRSMISEKYQYDLSRFCHYEVSDGQTDEEIADSIREMAIEYESIMNS